MAKKLKDELKKYSDLELAQTLVALQKTLHNNFAAVRELDLVSEEYQLLENMRTVVLDEIVRRHTQH